MSSPMNASATSALSLSRLKITTRTLLWRLKVVRRPSRKSNLLSRLLLRHSNWQPLCQLMSLQFSYFNNRSKIRTLNSRHWLKKSKSWDLSVLSTALGSRKSSTHLSWMRASSHRVKSTSLYYNRQLFY
jgi:hypothetical protein